MGGLVGGVSLCLGRRDSLGGGISFSLRALGAVRSGGGSLRRQSPGALTLSQPRRLGNRITLGLQGRLRRHQEPHNQARHQQRKTVHDKRRTQTKRSQGARNDRAQQVAQQERRRVITGNTAAHVGRGETHQQTHRGDREHDRANAGHRACGQQRPIIPGEGNHKRGHGHD